MEVWNHKSFLLKIFAWLCLPAALLLGLGSGSCQASGEVFLANSLSVFFPPSIPCAGPGGPYFTSFLVFPPYFGAEVSVRPMYLTMTQGRISNPPSAIYPLISGDLLRDFRVNPSITTVETMLRTQISRLSFRIYFGLKLSDSNGTLTLPGNNFVLSEFEYFKYRVGLDFDFICWGRSRAGVDVDLSADQPVFTVIDSRVFPNSTARDGLGNPAPGTPPYEAVGNNAFTVGVHVVYNPPIFVWDWSWIFEARVRWPARQDTQLTEYDFAAGLKSPETTRGSVAFRGGYRRTLLDFQTGPTTFSGAWSGWFGEMVYYY